MLRPGARVAVISPSGISNPERLWRGIAELEAWGFRPELLPHARREHRYLAGTDAERASDLFRAFSGDYDAVWMARGGYGLSRLVGNVNWEELAPVPFFGFSDGTVLLNALAARGRPAIHAPVLHALASHNDEATRTWLRALLHGHAEAWFPARTVRAGEAEGRLVGGNLCVLATLCGTPLQLDARGAVVLLEDLGEVPYKLDRLLVQLRDSGALAGARAILLGDFLDAAPPPGAPWTLDEVFAEVLGPLRIPIVAGLPIGHGRTNLAVPLGVPVHVGPGGVTLGRPR